MMFRNFLIKKTMREGVFYKFVDISSFSVAKYFHLLLKGHIVRKIRIYNYFKSHKIRKIQFGSAAYKYKGFLNTDIFGRVPIDITKKLPFRSNSIAVIYSSHLVEHIYLREFIKFLKESQRVLKKGGVNIIQTPSMSKTAKAVYCAENSDAWKYILADHKPLSLIHPVTKASYMNDVIHLFFGHKYLYDFNTIEHLAKKAGYSKVVLQKNNYDLPDKAIDVLNKNKFWDVTTETFLLYK